MILIFAFILIIRAVFWGLVAYRSHIIQQASKDRQARGLVATQKYSALSFLLETAFWFLIIIPNTVLDIRQFEWVRYLIVFLFSIQIVPAIFVWLWWEGIVDATEPLLGKFQKAFAWLVIGTIITGVFAVLYAVLTAPIF